MAVKPPESITYYWLIGIDNNRDSFIIPPNPEVNILWG
jgi:hypothetical protein